MRISPEDHYFFLISRLKENRENFCQPWRNTINMPAGVLYKTAQVAIGYNPTKACVRASTLPVSLEERILS